jgi:hypothetical protein
MQVIAGVLAWIVFVPLIELVRAAANRLGRGEGAAALEQPQAASRAPVAPVHPRRAA